MLRDRIILLGGMRFDVTHCTIIICVGCAIFVFQYIMRVLVVCVWINIIEHVFSAMDCVIGEYTSLLQTCRITTHHANIAPNVKWAICSVQRTFVWLWYSQYDNQIWFRLFYIQHKGVSSIWIDSSHRLNGIKIISISSNVYLFNKL